MPIENYIEKKKYCLHRPNTVHGSYPTGGGLVTGFTASFHSHKEKQKKPESMNNWMNIIADVHFRSFRLQICSNPRQPQFL